MVSCVVANCKNTSAKATKSRDGVTFHRFPQDEKRRKRWQIAVNREPEWTPTDSSTVCSEHFEVKDFYCTDSGLRRLAAEAVPTINISPCEELQSTVSDLDTIDIKANDSTEVIKLKVKIHRLEIIARNRKRKMKKMWQSNNRMRRKLEQMKAVIQHLIQRKEKN